MTNTPTVLMIGPGQPDKQNSGLGVAAHFIAQHLALHTHLLQVYPTAEDTAAPLPLADSDLSQKLISFAIQSRLAPYFYSSAQATDILDTQDFVAKKAIDQFTDQIVSTAATLSYDYIYAHDWTTMQAGLALKKSSGKPLVVHVHSLDYDRSSQLDKSWIYEIEKDCFDNADAIIGVSNYTKAAIAQQYDISPKKIATVHNASTPLKYKRRKHVFDEKIVLFVGRLTGQKGPEIFLDIAQQVLASEPNTRFVLAGEGYLKTNLLLSAAARKMGSKFHFTGHVNQKELEYLYSIADAYCMPSVSEPFGIAALEAACAGIPMVLSRQCGAAEVLPDALCADHWDIAGLAGHLLSILQDRTMANQLAKKNKAAAAKLTWDSTASKVLDVFNRIDH